MANPRKARTISQSVRKSDERDALVLARLGRADRSLLSPIVRGSERSQHDVLQIKLRDNLVRARVAVINSVRFALKSLVSAEQSFQRAIPQAGGRGAPRASPSADRGVDRSQEPMHHEGIDFAECGVSEYPWKRSHNAKPMLLP